MSVLKKFEAAYDAKDIDALAACFQPDREFHMHSSGKIIELDEWTSMFSAMLANAKRERMRCLYEITDILITHNFVTSAKGSVGAIMYVAVLKDGQIWRTETGSTPVLQGCM